VFRYALKISCGETPRAPAPHPVNSLYTFNTWPPPRAALVDMAAWFSVSPNDMIRIRGILLLTFDYLFFFFSG
jgi:hypothetical protein